MTTAAEIQAKMDLLSANMDRLDGITNGGPADTVSTTGGSVPSWAKFLADRELDAAYIAAMAAAGLYASEAAGLAATTDGDYFLVKGSGSIFASLFLNDGGSAVSQDLDIPSASNPGQPTEAVTSYAHPLGSGDRTAAIQIFPAAGLFSGTADNPFNGDKTGDDDNAIRFTSANLGQHSFGFNAGNGRRLVCDEVKIWWSSANHNHGGWALVGYRDGGPAEELATFDFLAASRTLESGKYAQTISVGRIVQDGVQRGFSKFVIEGRSGSYVALEYITEVDFKLANAVDDREYTLPTGGSVDQVVIQASSDDGDALWVDRDPDPTGAAIRGAWRDRALSEVARLRSSSTFFLSSEWGDDANFGHSGMQAKATVAGLLPRTTLAKGNFSKTSGLTNVYEISVDKGTDWHRDSVMGAFVSYATTRTALVPVSSLDDCDVLVGSYHDPSPGSRFTTLYLHAPASGNPGTDSLVYVAEESCPADGMVAVAAGSVFKGGITFEPSRGFNRIGVFGRGPLPEFDCTKALDEGDFTLSDHADADANVFEATVSNETGTRQLNDPEHQVFQTDPNGNRYSLETVASVAAVAARAGTVYFGTVGDEDTSARNNKGTAVAFIHPRFSADPTDQSGGEVYEYAYTKSAVSINSSNGVNDRTNTAQGTLVDGLIARGQVDGQGSIVTNEDAVLRRVMMIDGNKHQHVGVTGRVEDTIYFQQKADPIAGPVPGTFYRADAEGLDGEYTRALFIKPDHQRDGGNGFITHGSSGTVPDKHHCDQVVLFNGGSCAFNGLDLAVINDFLSLYGEVHRTYDTLAALNAAAVSSAPNDRDIGAVAAFDGGNAGNYVWNTALATPAYEKIGGAGVGIQAAVPTATKDGVRTYIRRALFETTGANNHINIPTSGAVASTTALVDIRHSAFRARDCNGFGSIAASLDVPTVVKNNTFIIEDRGLLTAKAGGAVWSAGKDFSQNVILNVKASSGQFQPIATINTNGGTIAGKWDYNVYCIANTSIPGIYVDGTFYRITNPAEWATYKAAVAGQGVDVNSVVLFGDDWKRLFAGDPRTGDYRLRRGVLTTLAGGPIQFGDGSEVNASAGVQEYLDWNKKAVLSGQPSRMPVPPKTEAECREYVESPWDWVW